MYMSNLCVNYNDLVFHNDSMAAKEELLLKNPCLPFCLDPILATESLTPRG